MHSGRDGLPLLAQAWHFELGEARIWLPRKTNPFQVKPSRVSPIESQATGAQS